MSNPADILSSVFDIEQVLQYIQDEDDNIGYLQDLKKHRDKMISEQISASKEKIVTYRQVILNTMKTLEPDKKTLPFPGVGKVTRRKPTGSWLIDDESSMIDHLSRMGVKDDVIEIIPQHESINKRKLKSVLDLLDKKGDVVDGVSRKEGEEGLSISYENDQPKNKKPAAKTPERPQVDIGSLTV